MFIPGKVLIIEDDRKQATQIAEKFWDAGQGVVCFNDYPAEDKIPPNVRLVVLDLVLGGDGPPDVTDYQQAALAIERIQRRTSFFLLAPYSIHIRDDEDKKEVLQNLREAYRGSCPWFFEQYVIEPLSKAIDPENLIQQIVEWVKRNPEAGLVFEWEKGVETARDKAASQLTNAGGIRTIVRALDKERGRAAVPLGTFTLFGRILLRHLATSCEEDVIETVTRQMVEAQGPVGSLLDWYPRIHYLQSYYQVDDKDSLFTGDILNTLSGPGTREYAIVITPPCDFVQKKARRAKVVYAVKFDHIEKYEDTDEEPPLVVRLLGKTSKGKWKEIADVSQALVSPSGGLPGNFYVLRFLRTSPDPDSYFHLLADFSDVECIDLEEIDGTTRLKRAWKRLCRIDSPYLEELIQKYASFCARVGSPDIPEDVSKEERKRLMS